MGDEIRITANIAIILRAFLDDAASEHYGIALMRATGIPSGTLYPTLARLEAAGLLVSSKENIDPVKAGRPPRRYYRLNPDTADWARAKVNDLGRRVQGRPAIASRRPGLAGA